MAKKTRNGMDIIKHRFGVDPRTDSNVQAFAEEFRIAQIVYDARSAAGMTQKDLAEAVGTTYSIIADLEAADFEGDAFSMLRRIADALHMKLRIELVPVASNAARSI